MMPSTVPSRPMRGLAEPMTASDGMKVPRASRSAVTSASSRRRIASTCDSRMGRAFPSPSFTAVSCRKLMARAKTRLKGDGGALRAIATACSSFVARANSRMNASDARLVRRNSSHFASMMPQLYSDSTSRIASTTFVARTELVMSSSGVVGIAEFILGAD